jgi:hypothetical protein
MKFRVLCPRAIALVLPAILALGFLPSRACATLLTFDLAAGEFADQAPVDQSYGDLVDSTIAAGFDFRYAENPGGWTPNVTVNYGRGTCLYTSEVDGTYGGLRNVIYLDPTVQGSEPTLNLRFRAPHGRAVSLRGFKLAAFNSGTPISRWIHGVTVRNEDGVILYASGPTVIDAIAHTAFNFNPPIESRILRVDVDAGTAALFIGMDDISFGEVSARTKPVQVRFFVSPEGSDSNDGTEAAPFRTLERARDAVRAANSAMTGNIEVILRGGRHELARPLELHGLDSGSNGFEVLWKSAGGEKAVISGGRRVTGWTHFGTTSGGVNIYRAPNPTDIYTRQMWVDNERRPRARGPLPAGMVQQPAVNSISPSVVSYATAPGSAARAMKEWNRNQSDIEFVYLAVLDRNDSGLPHVMHRICIDRIDDSSGNIHMKQPAWRNMTLRSPEWMGEGHAELPIHVENAWPLLDEPGEWYLARDEDMLYYIPKPGEDIETIEAIVPALETLIDGGGTLAAPVSRIQFSGIQFSHGTFLRTGGPDGFTEILNNFCNTGADGYVQGCPQLDPVNHPTYGVWTRTPANVRFAYAREMLFERCIFTHLGSVALSLMDGSQGNEILGCQFIDISGNAIEIGSVDKPETAIPGEIARGNTLLGNSITRIGVEYAGAGAVTTFYPQETLIARNLMHDLPAYGTTMGWGFELHSSNDQTVIRDNRITRNHIHDHVKVVRDYGAIYMHGKQGSSYQDGLVVDGNVIHGQRNRLQPIFNDGSSRWMRIYNNALFDNALFMIPGTDPEPIERAWGGCTGPDDGHLDFSHNFYTGVIPYTSSPPPGVPSHPRRYWSCGVPDGPLIISNNTRILGRSDVPESILSAAGLSPLYQDIRRSEPWSVVIGRSASNHVTLTFATAAGWYYDIYFADNLDAGFIRAASVLGAGGLMIWADDGSQTQTPPASRDARFYRVLERAP